MEFLLKARLPLFILALVAFFIGERYLALETYYLYVHLGTLALLVLVAVLPLLGALRAKKEGLEKEAANWWLVATWMFVAVLGVVFYIAFNKLVSNPASPETFRDKALLAAYLLFLVIGFSSGFGIELAHMYSGRGRHAEPLRLKRSAIGWLIVGMVLCFLVTVNYTAVKKDKAYDWSYLKTTTPSASTMNMFGSTEDKVEVGIFYPIDNEVRQHVQGYFDFLATKAKNVEIKYFDVDLDPTEAEALKVSRNGQVVLSKGEKKERIDIGLKISAARATLKKLDNEVQRAFLKLDEKRSTIYFTRGHGEFSWLGAGESPLESISMLERFLRSQNFELKFFGVGEGSTNAVPDDAAAVAIIGPNAPFMKEEVSALTSYLQKGGHLLVLVDVGRANQAPEVSREGDNPLFHLLDEAGIKFNREYLANDTNYVSATRSPADKWFLFSNSFTTHESVTSLAKHEERIALLLYQTGYFELESGKNNWKSLATVRSLTGTFVDKNRDFKFDQGKETKNTYDVAVAATLEIKPETPPVEAKKDEVAAKPEEKTPAAKEARIFAVGDANLVSDALIRNPANAVFIADAIKWLAGKTQFAGDIASEEDVKIQHTRKQDVLWFNGTVVAVPALVLLVGFFATRRRKRK